MRVEQAVYTVFPCDLVFNRNVSIVVKQKSPEYSSESLFVLYYVFAFLSTMSYCNYMYGVRLLVDTEYYYVFTNHCIAIFFITKVFFGI